MKKLMIAAGLLVAAGSVGGCGGGASNNAASGPNNAAPAAAPIPVPNSGAPAVEANQVSNSSASVTRAADPGLTAFRQAAIQSCATAARQNPRLPAGIDAVQVCTCGFEASFGNRTDYLGYGMSEEGRRAFARAIFQCARESAGGAAEAAPAASKQ